MILCPAAPGLDWYPAPPARARTRKDETMSRAWLFQDHRRKRLLGEEKCPWSVGWVDPAGKRRSKKIGTRSKAEDYRRKLEGELTAGIYQDLRRATWDQFLAEYESKVLVHMRPETRETTQYALNHFDRIIGPKRLASIKTATIDEYVSTRRTEANRKNGSSVSPATINRELRTIRAVLRKAVRWGYLARCPEFEFLREPGKLVTYVHPEDFQAIYAACDSARWPDCGPFCPADWWRALLVFGYMTGWRIGAMLALRWQDVDLDGATAFSPAEDNKGKRDQLVPLHALVVDHLQRLVSFHALVFAWNHNQRAVLSEFHALQDTAGVKPIGGKAHYGFHDLRRAFATLNSETLTADALQLMMQHRAYATTQRYINLARQASTTADKLFVPKISGHSAG